MLYEPHRYATFSYRGAGSPHIWYMFWFGMDAYLARPFISLAHHYKRSVAFAEELKALICSTNLEIGIA
jgi:hypothetical protein